VTAPYNFGMSQEDERTEAAALQLGPEDHVLSVASAGDMALNLLALGAARVVAVDVHPGQLELCRLKAAAVGHLDRLDALRLLGFVPANGSERVRLFRVLTPHLSPDARSFWHARQDAVRQGAIWAGRYERYVRTLVRLVRPIFGHRRVERLFACSSLEEQQAFFEREVNRWAIRALFRLAFHPKLYATRGMDPTGLSQREAKRSLGDQFFEQFRLLCTGTPVRENYLLQLTLLGRLLGEDASPDATPAYLSERGFARARANLEGLAFHRTDLVDWVSDAPYWAFDKAHLSNVVDWLSAPAFSRLLRALVRRVTREERSIRVVWRFLHADRYPPADLAPLIRVDRALGQRLQRTDRFPFYGVVPAVIDGSSHR